MHHGQRFTVAMTYVLPEHSTLAVLQRLIQWIHDHRVVIQRLYLDKGFCQTDVIEYLQQAKLAAIIACPIRGKPGGASAASNTIAVSGRFVAFQTEADNLGGPIDTDVENVYVYDRDRKKLALVSRQSKPAGNQGADDISQTPAISASGRFVVFESEATNLGGPLNTPLGDDNVYMRDRG